MAPDPREIARLAAWPNSAGGVRDLPRAQAGHGASRTMAAVAMLLSVPVLEISRRRIDANDRATTARMLGIITALQVVSLMAFGLASTFALAVAALWGYAVARNIAGPLYATWLMQRSSQEVRATVFSIVAQVDALGQIVGSRLSVPSRRPHLWESRW